MFCCVSVMGHVLSNGLELMGTGRSPLLDAEFKASLDKLSDLSASSKINAREKLHVEAVLEWSEGWDNKICLEGLGDVLEGPGVSVGFAPWILKYPKKLPGPSEWISERSGVLHLWTEFEMNC